MTIIPRISKALQKKHIGQSAAIVQGEIVAFGKNTADALIKGSELGYERKDIMIAYIMGDKNYAV